MCLISSFVLLGSLIALPFACAVAFAALVIWIRHSHADFAHGSFDDAGANMYVSASGRMQVINRWDVDDDCYLDILSPNIPSSKCRTCPSEPSRQRLRVEGHLCRSP